MKPHAAICVALAGCLLAAQALAAEPRLGKLKAYDAPYYTLISDTPAQARNMHARLARFERVLVKMLGREMEPTGTPTYFVLVNGAAWIRYLQPAEGIAGAFMPRRFSNYMLVNADAGKDRLPHDVQHEFTHLFLRTQFRGEYPLWFDEGMAELMEHTVVGDRSVRFVAPLRGTKTPWIPFSRLAVLEWTSPEYLSLQTTESVRLQSWALVHLGFIEEPAFGAGILGYIESINHQVPVKDAVQNSFGMSVADVDAKLRGYVARDRYSIGELAYEAPPPSPLGDGRQLGDGEAYAVLARTMLDTGLNPKRVREVIDLASAASADSASVAVLRLRLAARDRDDAEVERQYRLLTGSLDGSKSDPAIARSLGLALFDRVRDESAKDSLSPERRAEWSRRAFELLDAALNAQPGDGEATWAYALLAARLGENLDTALSRLAFTRTRVRENSDLAMAMALVHESRGSLDEMMPFLEEAALYADSADKRQVANSRIAEIRRRLSESAPL